jgi:hypothetical protein
MNLMVTFPQYSSNDAFDCIYKQILEQLQIKYPSFNVVYNNSQDSITRGNISTAAFGGISNLSIVNTDNNKCVVLSFADIDEVYTYEHHGWRPDRNIVQIFGSLRWGSGNFTSEKIEATHKIKYSHFQYPVAYKNFHEYATQERRLDTIGKRNKKAFFCGMPYDFRKEITLHLDKHPMIDVIPAGDRYEYYRYMNEYDIIIALNGIAEWTMRDIESMAFGIPIVRSEMLTQRYHQLIPDVHYIKATEPTPTANMVYPGMSGKQVAEQFIDVIEKSINDEELLQRISTEEVKYYEQFCTNEYMVELFMKLFDPMILE